MKKQKERGRYKSLSLPEAMLNQIEIFIKKRSELGFSSISAFVQSAVRHEFERYK